MLKHADIYNLDCALVPIANIVEKLFDESNKKAIIFIA